MLPSNISLSKNIEFLLTRYRHQKLTKQSPQESIFIHPSLKDKQKHKLRPGTQQQVFAQKQKLIQDRIRLIHNYSFKKLRSLERRRKKSRESMGRHDSLVSRYNMSIDSTIQFPNNQSIKHSRSREESFDTIVEEKLLRRRGTTQYVGKGSQRGKESQNKTLQVKEHCQLDYNYQDQEKKYQIKKKQWVASRFQIFGKTSPRGGGLPIIKNTVSNSLMEMDDKAGKVLEETEGNVVKIPLTIKTKRNRSKGEKEDIITPTITPLNLIKKGDKKNRHTKQMYFKRVLKSKTQTLKFQDDNISPWDRLPQPIAQDESHMAYNQDHNEYF